MPPLLFVFQIALPLGLLAWLAIDRTPVRAVYAVRAVSTAVVLVTIALIAPWAMPPWWTPFLYGAVLVVTVVLGLVSRQRGIGSLWQWIASAPIMALAIYGAGQTWQAVEGRRPPVGEAVQIGIPLGPGRYLVENGGSTLALNGHLHTADPNDPLHATDRGQAYALDIVALGRFGLRSSGFWPADPARYAVFGKAVLAPCDGEVRAAVDGREDQRVPEQDLAEPAGNHVVLDCGDFVVVLAHLQKGSVEVAPGESVPQGMQLGRVGNSGASTEPHLHVHAERQTDPAATSGEPLWLWLDGQFLVRSARFRVPR